MSEFLPVHVQNVLEDNEELLPDVAVARPALEDVLLFCSHYRVAGIGSLLLSGESTGFRARLSQSGRAFSHYLGLTGVEQPVLGQAAPFFDAVASGDLDAARQIATRLRRGWAQGEEYEEDFLFPEYLMQRFFLGAQAPERAALLDRWEAALQGSDDTRLPLCRALDSGDGVAFSENFPLLGDEWRDEVEELSDSLEPEQAETERYIWVPGVALARLAASVGFQLLDEYTGIPSQTREDGGVSFSPDSWRQVGA